jgi:hypothetical protein
MLAPYWPPAASNPEASERHIEAARLMSDLPKYGVKELARFAAIANLDAFVS